MNCDEKSSDFILEISVLDKSKGDAPAVITEQPVWERVELALESVFENGGFVNLRVLSPKDAIIKKLNMNALPGKYRLVILTRSNDPKAELQEWWEPGDSPFRGLVRFGDDDWDARTVCSDLSVAQDIFRELFMYGNLTAGLRQMRSPWDPKP